MSIITLTTDFGYRDEYVGVIKGVILKINPGITIVDITHEIPAQDFMQAGHTLKAAFGWFPEGTIHIVVVDPGVGSERAVLAAHHAGHFFIAPDNGLLPVVWGGLQPRRIVRVQNSELFLHPVSATFHGRDIFAPAGAHLASGMRLDELGAAVNLTQIRHPALTGPEWLNDWEIQGHITNSDHFGNLRTDIAGEEIQALKQQCKHGTLIISLGGDRRIFGLAETYAESKKGRLIALINSRNQLEIAVAGGNAAQLLKAYAGLTVRVTMRPADDS